MNKTYFKASYHFNRILNKNTRLYAEIHKLSLLLGFSWTLRNEVGEYVPHHTVSHTRREYYSWSKGTRHFYVKVHYT